MDPDQARAFLAALGMDFPSAEGGGRLRERYGYRGLPNTLVLDRELRVVRRLHGFGGDLAPIDEALAEARSARPYAGCAYRHLP